MEAAATVFSSIQNCLGKYYQSVIETQLDPNDDMLDSRTAADMLQNLHLGRSAVELIAKSWL